MLIRKERLFEEKNNFMEQLQYELYSLFWNIIIIQL